MATLLVIGGSGFFGKSILSSYQRGELKHWCISLVKILSRSASSLMISNPELVRGYPVELHDIDIELCQEIPSADILIYAVGETEFSRYFASSTGLENDIVAVSKICDLIQNKLSKSKILYISSGAIYGSGHSVLNSFTENNKPNVHSGINQIKEKYAEAKKKSEIEFKKLANKGVNVGIARCFTFVGEYLPRRAGYAIGNFIEDGLQGRPIIVKAINRVYRSYMHTDDLVQWLLAIAMVSSSDCPVYNVGAEEKIEIRELAEQIGRYFGCNVESKPIQKNDIDYYLPNTSLIKKELSVTIRISLNEAIERTIQSIKRSS